MGAPEVLGEQVSTPFAGHDLPGVLREQLHGLSDPSDPRRFRRVRYRTRAETWQKLHAGKGHSPALTGDQGSLN